MTEKETASEQNAPDTTTPGVASQPVEAPSGQPAAPQEPATPPKPEPKPEAPPAPVPPPPQIIRERVVEVRQEKGGISRLKIALALIALLAAVAIVGMLTLTVQIQNPDPGNAYPYTTTYDVHFPLAQPVTIGSTKMIALTAEDEMIIQIDQNPGQKIVVGEERKISERKAVITVFGARILQTNFQIYLRYLGMDGNKARFYLTVKRSNDVPQFIIDRLLPPEIDARPA
ncbi:MAG: hypothetical protein GKC04_05160 [Methanomicrobiales archaeon]|nr:hypothetical protein [Methanomicrobiales archaeon]